MKRFLFTVLLFILLVSTPVQARHRINNHDRNATKKLVTRYMEAVKRYDTKTYLGCYQPKKYRKGVRYWFGKGMIKYLRRTKKDYFSYTISEIKLKSRKGTAYVTVSYYDTFSDLKDAWKEYFYEHLFDEDFDFDFFCDCYLWYQYEFRENREYKIKTEKIRIPLIYRKGRWRIEKQNRAMDYMEDGGFNHWYSAIMREFP